MSEETWVVHWEGPSSISEAKEKKGKNPGYVLYQLTGLHHLYGSNVLLYVGQTSAGIKTRLGQHDDWIDYEYDEMKVRLGSISKFHSWDSWERGKKPYPNPGEEIIKKVEKLLIFANQPAYNTANKAGAKDSKRIRIFNTGRLGSLFPETSSWYFLDQ